MMKKEKNAINLIKRGKFTDAVDQYNEIAHDFQKNGDLEEAIQFCEKGSSLAREHHQFFEGSLCERRLSELHALLGNREPCLQHLVSFRRMALKCASRSQEQLSFHVEAWCLQQLYQNGAGELRDIERAVQAVEMSRKLVDQYKTAFRDGEPGATPKHRKAELFILEAQLQEQLGNNSKALQLLDKAEHFLSANDKSIRYELRRTQCSVAPIARRIDIAELMEDEAPEDKKAIALNDLAHLYVVFNRLSYGYTKLATVYITHGKNLIANDLDEVTKRLCILYRLVKYTNILQNPRLEPKISLCELHEATGDLFDKYYQTMLEKEKREYRHFVRDNILKHFGKMLENRWKTPSSATSQLLVEFCARHKRSDDDVRRAYNAMALIYVDLEEHSKALDYFEKHLEVLNRLGVAENQIIDTRLSILSCQCKLHYSDVQKSFSALKEKVALPNHKKELFDIWSDYCSDQLQEQEAKKWREMAEQIPDVVVKNEDDETDVLFGKLSDEEVLERIVDENELLRLDNMTEYQLKKTNDKGETILHHAAQQPDNEAVVEKLCRQGCNVNARDNGGWTPLSEAVAHEELDNARVLLRYGADVNSRSVESFVSSEESQTSSSSQNHHTSLTPLMEACANGFVRMARLLIENKAKIELKDSAGWTAYDHFRRHLAENGCTEEQKQFDEFLKNEMKKCNLAIKIPLVSSLKSSRIELDDSPTPDDEDDLIIMDSLASRKRRFSPDPTDKTAPKRQPKNRENARLPAVQKRPHFTPPTAHSNRNLRLSCSLLSSRKSTSPTTTIRSAPSVIDGADEVQCLGIQRKRKSLSPKRPSPRSVAKPRPPASSSSTPSISARETLDVLPVKCVFELSAGLDKIHPVMLPLARTLTIGETKLRLLEHIRGAAHLKIASVWKSGDPDKCLLADQLQLCHVAIQGELALVFQLAAPPAHEVYEHVSKAPIPEVTTRLKQFDTAETLDLSGLFLDENELLEVTKTLKTCERRGKMRLEFSCCDFSPEDQHNIRQVLENCAALKIANSSGFSAVFQTQKFPLQELEISACDFRDETQILNILECCPDLKTLKLTGICLKSGTFTGLFSDAVRALVHLKTLDLTFNTWISDENWLKIFQGMDNLETINISENKCGVEFESYWLPSVRSFTARGCSLRWDSALEMLSMLENVDSIDVRYSNCDANLVGELRKSGKKIQF